MALTNCNVLVLIIYFQERADIEQMVLHSSSFYEQHGDSNVVSRVRNPP